MYTLTILNGQHGTIRYTLQELSVSLLVFSVILCKYIVTKNKKYLYEDDIFYMRKIFETNKKKLKTLQTGG